MAQVFVEGIEREIKCVYHRFKFKKMMIFAKSDKEAY